MEEQDGSLVDRPRMNAGYMLTGGLVLGFTHVGDRFRRMRSFIACRRSSLRLTLHRDPEHSIRISSLRQLKHISLCRCHSRNTRSLTFLMIHPTSSSYAMTTIVTVAFGKTAPTFATDPEVITLRRLVIIFRTVLRPGAYLVDSIPWLIYPPWYSQTLQRGFEDHQILFTDQTNRPKQRTARVPDPPAPERCPNRSTGE
ncbi:hypothetical protein EDB19DRAFT_641315 [Suillus lakei]|nr:hypothetical protein EDB19DRAFT_641315 [Suillus lakei]